MKKLLTGWDLMRMLRMALGVFIILNGWMAGEWLFVGFGVLFSLMAILNFGCCSMNGCATPLQKTKNKTEEITYEEIR